jgi:hypothetical protein
VALRAEFENYVMMMPEIIQAIKYDFAEFKRCFYVRIMGAER